LPSSVAVGDFNNDARLDIVVTNGGDNNIDVLLGYENIILFKRTFLTTGDTSRPQALATADFNNDMKVDILVANSGVNNIGIFLGYGNGIFANQTIYSTGHYPLSVAVGDLNDDTRLDIVVANHGSNSISVFYGYGDGSFANQLTYFTSFAPHFVSVGDFNNDSFLDIIVTISDISIISIFFGYGKGTFANLMKLSMNYGSLPSSLVVCDFNNDMKLDFAVVNEGTDSLQIMLQTC
jgi:hypothetical protein